MVKEINYKKFLLISLGFSVIIFTAGLLLGISLDTTKVNDLVVNINQNELNIESYNIEKEFLATFGGDVCSLSGPRVEALSEEVGKIGRLLDKYETTNLFEENEFNYLKRKYFLLEIKAYSLFTTLKKECNYNYTTILFFYDINEGNSLAQGNVLDALIKIKPNTHIFSFDKSFKDDPTLETLKIHYDINTSPTLIINDKTKQESLINLDDLIELTN
ncbi:MAG: hypothetical protein AABW45_00890 [Nanoarchaeota archaeon]